MGDRPSGKYGLKVSEVALGPRLTFGNATGNEMAEACIDRAYKIGINFFDLTLPQLALARCLRQKNVSSVIIGASRPDRLDDNAAADARTLPPGLIARMKMPSPGETKTDEVPRHFSPPVLT